jgi:hypothetical protein
MLSVMVMTLLTMMPPELGHDSDAQKRAGYATRLLYRAERNEWDGIVLWSLIYVSTVCSTYSPSPEEDRPWDWEVHSLDGQGDGQTGADSCPGRLAKLLTQTRVKWHQYAFRERST